MFSRLTDCLIFGAGEGNRTLVVSLEGFCSTIELHPQHIEMMIVFTTIPTYFSSLNVGTFQHCRQERRRYPSHRRCASELAEREERRRVVSFPVRQRVVSFAVACAGAYDNSQHRSCRAVV